MCHWAFWDWVAYTLYKVHVHVHLSLFQVLLTVQLVANLPSTKLNQQNTDDYIGKLITSDVSFYVFLHINKFWLHCIALYCTVLHCVALYCTVLHCIALYCTVLKSTHLQWNILWLTKLFWVHVSYVIFSELSSNLQETLIDIEVSWQFMISAVESIKPICSCV